MRSVPPFSEKSVEILGIESTYGEHAQALNSREVVVKIAVKHMFKEACMFFASEIAQASTGMAPALAGIVGGRPKASPVIKLFSFLIDKKNRSMSKSILRGVAIRLRFLGTLLQSNSIL